MQALVEASDRGRPFALVLLDANMPEMDGFEVARRIRDEAKLGATIMMLSSSGQFDESSEVPRGRHRDASDQAGRTARAAGGDRARARPGARPACDAAVGDAARRSAGAAAERAARGRQHRQPAAGGEPARAPRTQSRDRRQRPRGGRGDAAAVVRRRADGRADAGDGRVRSHRSDPVARARKRERARRSSR